MPTYKNHYAILGIPRDATAEEIRTAHREMALRYHPDTSAEPDANEHFILIQQAYEVLSNVEQRKAFDATLPADFGVVPIKIMTLFSRASIQRLSEKQIFYALLRISPKEESIGAPIPPLNICLCVDCSTSMQGVAMDTVKSTAISLVRQMRPEDIFSVIAFSDKPEVIVPAGTNQELGRVETSVRMLRTGGGTEIFQGLEAALKEVQRYRSGKRINHIVLITDGRTYGDEDRCYELAQQASALGVGISGLGIGTKWNDFFLDRLTSCTGGSSMFVSRAREVEFYLKEKFAGLGSSYADHLKLTFKCDEGIELRSAFRLQPDTAPLHGKNPIQIGPMPRDGSVEVMLEFTVPPIGIQIETVNLIKGRLSFDIPSQKDPHFSMRIDLTRQVSNDPDPLPPPQAVIQSLSRLTLYRIQERARKDLEEGNVKEATRRLQYLATHLIAQGQRELARTVLGEAVHIQQHNAFSEEGDKRIKYGTRALMLPTKSE